jgi:hypothetical protein
MLLKVLAIVYCDTDKESRRITGQGWVYYDNHTHRAESFLKTYDSLFVSCVVTTLYKLQEVLTLKW